MSDGEKKRPDDAIEPVILERAEHLETDDRDAIIRLLDDAWLRALAELEELGRAA